MRSKISIAILSYNHPQLSARTVESALLQSFPVILIHNGSELKNVVELKEKFPQIQHVVIQKNRGFSGGVNEALRQGFKKSDWVLFLTNDTWIETALDNLPLPSTLKPGIYCPLTLMRSTQNIDSLGGWFSPEIGKLSHNRSVESWQSRTPLKYVPGSAFLIHQTVFNQTGDFDERLGTYWEDVDFSVRLQQKGFSIGLLPDLVIRHGVGKTCRGDSHYTIYLYHRNRRIVSMRYCPWIQKPGLYLRLYRDIFIAMIRLVKTRRWGDVKLLWGFSAKP